MPVMAKSGCMKTPDRGGRRRNLRPAVRQELLRACSPFHDLPRLRGGWSPTPGERSIRERWDAGEYSGTVVRGATQAPAIARASVHAETRRQTIGRSNLNHVRLRVSPRLRVT